ncbi:thioesterase [Spirosoma luteolum]
MTHIQTDTITINGYDCDAYGRLSVPALMNFMQEAANRNALAYGIGIADLATRQVGWMLMRFRLRMHQYPTYGQTIRVVTYPTAVEKYFIYRDFQVLADDGTLLAEATSTWLVFATDTRTMVPMPAFIRSLVVPQGITPQPHLPAKPDFLNQAFVRATEKLVEVGWLSIDMNHHVNNVAYVQWLLESIDHQWLHTREIAELDLVYRAECHLNDRLRAQSAVVSEGEQLHRIEHSETGKEVLLARSRWRGFGLSPLVGILGGGSAPARLG